MDDMNVNVENLKESTKKLLELISNYNKVAEYKVNIQKSTAFLYINNEQVDFEIKNNVISISTLNMKYFGIYLTKQGQNLHEQNYKTDENIKKELNGEIFHVHRQEDSILSRGQLIPT